MTKRYRATWPGPCTDCGELIDVGEQVALVGGPLDRHFVCDGCADNYDHEEDE